MKQESLDLQELAYYNTEEYKRKQFEKQVADWKKLYKCLVYIRDNYIIWDKDTREHIYKLIDSIEQMVIDL